MAHLKIECSETYLHIAVHLTKKSACILCSGFCSLKYNCKEAKGQILPPLFLLSSILARYFMVNEVEESSPKLVTMLHQDFGVNYAPILVNIRLQMFPLDSNGSPVHLSKGRIWPTVCQNYKWKMFFATVP